MAQLGREGRVTEPILSVTRPTTGNAGEISEGQQEEGGFLMSLDGLAHRSENEE